MQQVPVEVVKDRLDFYPFRTVSRFYEERIASRKETCTKPILLEEIIAKGKSCAYFLCEPNSYGDMDFLYIFLFFEDQVHQIILEHDFDDDGYNIASVELSLEEAMKEIKRESDMITYGGLDLFSIYDELKSRDCPGTYIRRAMHGVDEKFDENIRKPLFHLAYIWLTNNIGYDSFPLDEFLDYLSDHLILKTSYRGEQIDVLDKEHYQKSITKEKELFEDWWNNI